MAFLNRLARKVSANKALRRASLAARDFRQAAAIRRLAAINAFERRVYSQNGEDGIIAELFARIPNGRQFLEIGVEDGQQCNTALLARHYGWKGLLVEADDQCFERLASNFADFDNVAYLKLLVNAENIAAALEGVHVPKTLDLLCIDIDGNDYYVWKALAEYHASVVVIEYNAAFGPDLAQTIAYNPDHVWQRTRYYGASLYALEKLGRKLGYALIGTDNRGINAFFVRRDQLSVSGFPEKTAKEAWRANRLGGLLPKGNGELIRVEEV